MTGGLVSNGGVASGGRAPWLPRAFYTGPGAKDVDFRLGKQFAYKERVKLLLLGEAFNLFNHTNITSVNTTGFNFTAAGSGVCAGHTNACLSPNAAFMAATATSNLLTGARQLQISGKITF